MEQEQIRRLYDHAYAAAYNEKFLTSDLARSDAAHEIQLLRTWLTPEANWLDVACGTGFFLAQFPSIMREGLDVSPAMLALARVANPGVTFHEGSFLERRHGWDNHWDLVSCMWYAYGLVDSLQELKRLVRNLAAWTSPTGRCFVPLADPRLIAGVDLPYQVEGPWPGQTSITGILWSYAEDNGAKVHEHQLAPHVEYLEELFAEHFSRIDLETYPPAMPGWVGRRRALVASRKKG